ncbi:MAG: hypothetical protein QXF86_02385 [Candidatus Bilamarchaeaceae archaeon]
MVKKVSCKRAFLSYDAMFSIMPLLFLVVLVFQLMSLISSDSIYTLQKRELFNTLVAIADYAVKIGLATKDANDNLQPNLIDESKIPFLVLQINNGLENSNSNIRKIQISLDTPSSSSQMCIYRLVVVDSLGGNQIKKLYVCGSYANS